MPRHRKKPLPARRPETATLTRDEFFRALQAEEADHSPSPGAIPFSLTFEMFEQRNQWGVIRHATSERWNGGPVIESIDKAALAKIAKRNKRLANGRGWRQASRRCRNDR